jgi:hypothetical protein
MYRFLREGSLSNPNPILMAKGSVAQISHQLTDYVLCNDCEGLFDRNGENWVVSKMARLDRFPLWELMNTSKPVAVDGEGATFDGVSIPGIKMEKLVYFGLSVFWRGSAPPLRDRRGPVLGITLGPYEEEIRKFLLSEAPFPENVAIVISTSPTKHATLGAFAPTRADLPFPAYLFYVPGIQFVLAAGARVSEELRGECAHRYGMIFSSAAVERNVRYSFRSFLTPGNVAGVRKTLQEIASMVARRPKE